MSRTTGVDCPSPWHLLVCVIYFCSQKSPPVEKRAAKVRFQKCFSCVQLPAWNIMHSQRYLRYVWLDTIRSFPVRAWPNICEGRFCFLFHAGTFIVQWTLFTRMTNCSHILFGVCPTWSLSRFLMSYSTFRIHLFGLQWTYCLWCRCMLLKGLLGQRTVKFIVDVAVISHHIYVPLLHLNRVPSTKNVLDIDVPRISFEQV